MAKITLPWFIAVLVVASASAGDTAKKQTIDFVRKLQTPSGGFLAAPGTGAPSLRATSAAVRALRYLGAEAPAPGTCRQFIDRCYDPQTGGFADTPQGKPELFTTAIGLMAAAELLMSTEKYDAGATKYLSDHAKTFEEIRIAVAGVEAIRAQSPKKEQWIADVRKLQNADGTFGKGAARARDTGGSVVALLRMGAKPADADVVLKVLRDGQRPDGGYGKDDAASDLESTYRVLRCFMMLKTQPKNLNAVRSFIAKCRNDDGGYGVAPGQPSTVNGVYFASIMHHWFPAK